MHYVFCNHTIFLAFSYNNKITFLPYDKNHFLLIISIRSNIAINCHNTKDTLSISKQNTQFFAYADFNKIRGELSMKNRNRFIKGCLAFFPPILPSKHMKKAEDFIKWYLFNFALFPIALIASFSISKKHV